MASVKSVSVPMVTLDGTGVGEFRAHLRAWLARSRSSLPPLDEATRDFDARVESVRRLQRALYDAGWLRYGWPEALGGLGGDARHRAVVYDELGRAGLALRGPCEHLEIIAAPLVRHWSGLDAPTFAAFLRGDELWCQGFTEPDAGSDLTSLRTRAVRDGDVYRMSGEKLWTSWAGNATRCLVLARTGSHGARHRGLSAFFVDLATPGIDVRRLRQGNGSEELAQVSFADVEVPKERLVGAEGDGFAVALDVLACERSSFAWLRQAALHARADELSTRATEASDSELGELLLDLFAVRAAAGEQVQRLAEGAIPGPEAAVVKVLLTRAEQQLYDTAARVLGAAMPLGLGHDMARWQEEYLFSRAVSIYGGTKQVQLTTVARFLLGLPTAEARVTDLHMELVDAAEGIFRAWSGIDALARCEWDPTVDAEDEAALAPVGSLFRAHGRSLAITPALGALAAATLDDHATDHGDGLRTAGFNTSVDGDRVGFVGVGGVHGHRIVLDVPGRGVFVGDGAAAVAAPADSIEPDFVRTMSIASASLDPVARPAGERARRRAEVLVRIAIAHEMLGVCDAVLALATHYAGARTQFGQPIGSFQAVQHLLADAAIDARGLAAAGRLAVERPLAADGQEQTALYLKALAGRSARRVLQATLQTFGAIGFSWEHDHHRFTRRVLALDAIGGTADELSRSIGALARGGAIWRPVTAF